MCGKNKKVQHFYEVFFLQIRCMYTKGKVNKENVCYFFNFNLKTNECVLNFGFAFQSKVDVTSGGDYHCFLLILSSSGVSRMQSLKTKAVVFDQLEFKFLSYQNLSFFSYK